MRKRWGAKDPLAAAESRLPGGAPVLGDVVLDPERHQADSDSGDEDHEDEEEAEERDLLLGVVRKHEESLVHGELQRKWIVVVVVEESAWNSRAKLIPRLLSLNSTEVASILLTLSSRV